MLLILLIKTTAIDNESFATDSFEIKYVLSRSVIKNLLLLAIQMTYVQLRILQSVMDCWNKNVFPKHNFNRINQLCKTTIKDFKRLN